MALKAIMLRRDIERKTAELTALRKKDAEFEKREADLEEAISEAETEEQQAAVYGEVEKYDAEKAAHEAEKDALERAIADLEEELKDCERECGADNKQKDERSNVNTMNNINIRSLPMNQRAFDAYYTMEQRKAIVAQNDVQEFFGQLRSLGMNKRSVSGAELTVPVVFLDLIAENMFRYSKLMNRVRVREVRGEARQTIAGLVPPAVWTECCAALNELTFTFGQITADCYKVAGFVPLCNSILNDSDLNLAGTIVEMISESIGMAKDMAILYGTGIKMPQGIVTRLAQTSKPADYPATAPEWVDLHTTNVLTIDASLTGAAFWAALTVAAGNTFTRYSRGNQFWAMNSKTYNLLKSKVITFTATGDIAANVFGTLPIINGDIDILEFIPDNDIIGGYGDLYLWAQRAGMFIGMDDVGYVNRVADQTLFFGKERADGKPIIPGAFVVINIAGSSPTTSISFPGDAANDADLASLVLGTETLAPTFDAGTQSYAVTVSNASDAVTAIAANTDADVVVSYDGDKVINGSTVTWKSGTKNLVVEVKKGNAAKTYTVAVTKN